MEEKAVDGRDGRHGQRVRRGRDRRMLAKRNSEDAKHRNMQKHGKRRAHACKPQQGVETPSKVPRCAATIVAPSARGPHPRRSEVSRPHKRIRGPCIRCLVVTPPDGLPLDAPAPPEGRSEAVPNDAGHGWFPEGALRGAVPHNCKIVTGDSDNFASDLPKMCYPLEGKVGSPRLRDLRMFLGREGCLQHGDDAAFLAGARAAPDNGRGAGNTAPVSLARAAVKGNLMRLVNRAQNGERVVDNNFIAGLQGGTGDQPRHMATAVRAPGPDPP